jgi:hypothetical protein
VGFCAFSGIVHALSFSTSRSLSKPAHLRVKQKFGGTPKKVGNVDFSFCKCGHYHSSHSFGKGCRYCDCKLSDVEVVSANSEAAEHRMHLTAFGVGTAAVIPLQASLFADDQPATIGGR